MNCLHSLLSLGLLLLSASSSSTKINFSDTNTLILEKEDLFNDNVKRREANRFKRGIAYESYRWYGYPGIGIIPFIIDSSIDPGSIPNITAAMKQYQDNTCIRFVLWWGEPQYIKIYKGKGCFATIGKNEWVSQPQSVSLGDGCTSVGVIVHELGHTVGFFHEQSRADHDQHLDVFLHNVIDEEKHNFKKHPISKNLLLTPFDYNSIMMYSNYEFSKNNRKTLVAKNGQKLKPVWEKDGLTKSDIERVNLLYKCKKDL